MNHPIVEVAGSFTQGAHPGGLNGQDALMGYVVPVELPAGASRTLAARRLTPRECERLMGLPDDWTRWTADGMELADGSRYRMVGNSVATPVAEWVGRCILEAAA